MTYPAADALVWTAAFGILALLLTFFAVWLHLRLTRSTDDVVYAYGWVLLVAGLFLAVLTVAKGVLPQFLLYLKETLK